MSPSDLKLKETNPSNLSPVIGYITLLRQEVITMKQENLEMRQEVQELKEQLAKQVESLTETQTEYGDRLKSTDFQLNSLQYSYLDLQHCINILQGLQDPSHVMYEIEIIGVPETPSENLTNVILVISEMLSIQLSESDIDEVVRIGSNNSRKLRPILLTLLRRQKRNELLNASKTIRNLNSEVLVSGSSNKIYINERLPKESRMLFQEARLRAHANGFRYCWVKNGRIHVRQDKDKPSINITSILDLDEKVGQGITG